MSNIITGACYIEVDAGVRYWEDATVNGVEDTDGTLIPGREGDAWQVRIELLNGIIVDWPEGVQAAIHYKVCDQGQYWLLDAGFNRIAKWGGYYVPDEFLCHGSDGFGDYIILNVAIGGGIEGYEMPVIDPARWVAVERPPRMTPTNDAPVTVEETLRWYAENAAGCRKIGRDGDVFRQALDADGGKRALAALASAPAGDGVIAEVVELARRDIAREQTDFLGRMGQALCTYHGIFDDYPDGNLPEDVQEEADDQISALAGLALAQLILLRHPCDGTDPAAAIARPRAAVGEQSRSRRLTEEEARELVGFEPETILTCLREWGYVEDAALQSPPAKVEG